MGDAADMVEDAGSQEDITSRLHPLTFTIPFKLIQIITTIKERAPVGGGGATETT